MNRRVSVLLHWLRGHRNGIGVRELLTFLGRPPCRVRAQRMIVAVADHEDTFRIHIRGLPTALVWPKEADLNALYMVLGEQCYPNDWHFYETPETRVRQGDVAVDCGAAEGLFSMLAARRASLVYAIEPVPFWLKCLHETFASMPNVHVLACALSNRCGTAKMQGTGIAARIAPGGNLPVRVETIDNLFHRRGIKVDFLKADLEGHDLKMLEGAQETIRHYLPRIAVTTYHEPSHANAMMEYLSSLSRDYRFALRGIDAAAGAPVMLHAWT